MTSGRRAAIAIVLWLGLTFALASSGLLAFGSATPPPAMLVIAGATILTTFVGLSLPVERASIAALIAFQVFRVFVEIFLWMGHRDGFVPIQMTWEGRNLDVLTGLSAPVVAWLASRRWIFVWNLAGLALLLNVVIVAILSMPTPLRAFHNEPSSAFVAGAPYIWLPVFLVQAAWFGHLAVFRWLRLRGI